MPVRTYALIALLAAGCLPRRVEAPTPIETATAAVNLTDRALALAIEADPSQGWEQTVRAVELAADAVRRRDKVCDTLPALQLVASRVKCEQCFRMIAAAKDVMQCPN